MIDRLLRFGLAGVCGGAVWLATSAVQAHPHVFVDARTELVFDATGRLSTVRHTWRFDEGFSAFAVQGLDTNQDGVYTREELQPLAQVNVESLLEYDYFTMPRVDGKRVGFRQPVDYWLSFERGLLTLHYTLPLTQPLAPKGHKVEIDVFDPGYFVDFEWIKDAPVALVNAPACKIDVRHKADPDEATAAVLGSIPAYERELPRHLRALTETLANRIKLECP